MEKKRSFHGQSLWESKLLKVMKLTVFLMLISLMGVFASETYSQTTRLTVNANKMRLEDFLVKIENQSEFRFFYTGKIDVEQEVSGEFRNQKIFEILDEIKDEAGFQYEVLGRQIILSPNDSEGAIKSIQQLRTVSGKVTDKAGQPLPGVTVVIKGTAQGTVTNADGNYSLTNIPENATLVFSFVGMKTQEIPVGSQTTIDVTMLADAIGIEEVVATGYGIQRKVTLTGSISTVDSKFLENRPITNSSQALQGILGVYVNQEGGQPGKDVATIRIRGIGTLNDNNPLVLVDGIEGDLRDINPNDIETITVLKDAASAAIYGNRAANGVVLVTTKSGKKEKLKIELDSYYGWQQATYLPDMVTNSVDYMTALNEAKINEGQPIAYTQAQIDEFRNGTDTDLYPNTDWYDLAFSVAPMSNLNLRLSGGTDAVTYSTSIGYMDQTGVLIGTGAKKYSINSQIKYKYSEKLELGTIILGTFWDTEQSSMGTDQYMLALGRALPVHPSVLSAGNYGQTWLNVPNHTHFRNPLAIANETWQKDTSKRAIIKLFAEYTLPYGIKYSANFSVNNYDANTHRWIPEVYLINPKKPDAPILMRPQPQYRSVQRTNEANLDKSFFNTLKWDKRNIAGKHNIYLLAGFSKESFYRSNMLAYIEGFLGNELTELDAGNINKNVSGTSYESRLMSYFGRANYSYKDKYLLEFNFRYDGSSRFSKDYLWGFFPSGSAAWRINEENFLKDSKIINDLKFRASWGQLGNQNIPLYSYLSNIDINQGYSFKGTVTGGSAITTLSDPRISWETTTIANVGMDLSLWDNKLAINVDYFNKETDDILARINVPAQVGNLNGPITNLYGMSNKGVELSIVHQNSIRDFKYIVGGNIAYVKNNVDYLAGDVQFTNGTLSVIQEGHPVNSWFVYEALGYFQSEDEVRNHAFQHNNTAPGDLKYRDVNNDGVIDLNDKQILGRSFPLFTYSGNVKMEYKGFDLAAFFQGIQDVDTYLEGRVSFPVFNGAGIQKEYFYDHWTPENRDAKYPRLFDSAKGSLVNAQNSTFWLRDASYLRLKNLQLGYTFNSGYMSRLNIAKLRTYVNAQNLFTISSMKYQDPERTILETNLVDYPNVKIYSVGINLIF